MASTRLLTNTCLRQSPLGNDQTREIMPNTLMSSYSEQQCTHRKSFEASCHKEHFEQLQGDRALERGVTSETCLKQPLVESTQSKEINTNRSYVGCPLTQNTNRREISPEISYSEQLYQENTRPGEIILTDSV